MESAIIVRRVLAIVFIILVVVLIWGPLLLDEIGVPVLENSDLVAWTNVIRSLVEIAAIFIAGIWTYERFVASGEDSPYPEFEHNVVHQKLGESVTYLNLSLKITNKGGQKMSLGKEGVVYIRKIAPLRSDLSELPKKIDEPDVREGRDPDFFRDEGARVAWPEIGVRKWGWGDGAVLVPEQTKELQFDFVFEDYVSMVAIISWAKNPEKDKVEPGYTHTTFYKLV